MKACLAFNYHGQNHALHSYLWRKAVAALQWETVSAVERADFVLCWGPVPEFFAARELNKPVLMCDFPYWNRCGKTRTGKEYYKVSLNGQHPTQYVMQNNYDSTRYFETGGVAIKPWRANGTHILIAGMGYKAAHQHGFMPGQWETQTADLIKKQTDLPIVYRPKPGQKPYVRIQGTELDEGLRTIDAAIEGAHAVVCHHGNPTIAALQLGVPIFMNGRIGAASHLASFDMRNIMKPVFLDNRQQFLNNIAHWQWAVQEIASGQVLSEYKAKGFIG